MTMFSTQIQAITDLEGFKIEVFDNTGAKADMKVQGQPVYGYSRKAKDSMTVAEWKSRFHSTYLGFTCDVLQPNGTAPFNGNTKLSSVRSAYGSAAPAPAAKKAPAKAAPATKSSATKKTSA